MPLPRNERVVALANDLLEQFDNSTRFSGCIPVPVRLMPRAA